jgi:galactokinase
MIDRQALFNKLTNATIWSVAPGRVNLLGEHVDYNGGVVLPMAINKHVSVVARPNGSRRVSLNALDLDKTVCFDLDHLNERVDVSGQPLADWALYPAGVAWALQNRGLTITGIEAVYASDIPIGAGLGSSAAVELAFAVLWQGLGGWELDRMHLARMCQVAENHYVGVNCGLMDQFASAHGVARYALWFDTRSLEWQPIPLPPDTVVIVADSGLRRDLATSAYNERRAACDQAVQILKQKYPLVQSLRDISPEQLLESKALLPELIYKRAQHVVEEIARVNHACEYLMQDDAVSFGQMMSAAHLSLRDLYEVSCPELDALVEIANGLPGCYGARLTGAGFGGCTVNLVNTDKSDEFMEKLKLNYFQRTHRQADVYTCQASRGAYSEVIRN